MAVSLNVADIFRVTAVCSLGGQISENTTHWKVLTKVGGGATYQDVADYFDTNVGLNYVNAWLATDARYEGMVAKRLVPSPKTSQYFTTTSAQSGAVTGFTSAKQGCAIINWHSDNEDRHQRARIYMPFIPLSYLGANGDLNNTGAAALGAMAGFWNIFHTITGGGGSNTIGVVNYNDSLLVNDPQALPYQRYYRSIATQKRRSDYGKLNRLPF